MPDRVLTFQTPRVFLPLLAPGKRYRGAWGGRGGGKSWFFAERLIDRLIEEPTLRAVCVREFQKSLELSAKRLLEDVIARLGVRDRFRILNTHIETPKGGIILFHGMAAQTAQSIKSLEGFSLAWIEEAQSLSQRSLDLLRPTIREAGSEIWASWNPNQPSDPIDRLLRGDHVPEDAVVVEVNYDQNPFFPEVLRVELEWDRRRDYDKFHHVWCGGYAIRSEAQVFKNWTVEEFDTPADALFLFGGDWGYSVDPAVLVRMFIEGRRLYIDYEAYKIGVEIDHLPAHFDQVPGAREWEIIADSSRPDTISYMNRHGYPKIIPSIKGKDSVKEGIIFLQGYDIVIHPRCVHTIDEFRCYAYKQDPLTEAVTPILAEKKNHVIDSCRYAVEKVRMNLFDWKAEGFTSECTW